MTMGREKKIHTGLDGIVNGVYGFIRRKTFSLATLRQQAQAAHDVSQKAAGLTDDRFDEALSDCRCRLRFRPSPELLVESLGFIAEAAVRSLGIRPYPEQLMGARAAWDSAAIQMQTGEGKTITAAISAVMAGWRGGACHLVTANDYLARRDAGLMHPLYARCGLTVGHVIAGMNNEERRASYACDVTYSTSKELLADFLRDRMAHGAAGEGRASAMAGARRSGPTGGARVMRGLVTAIIDEADSVLIDEATVPLIISIPGKNRLLHEVVGQAREVAATLEPGRHFVVGQGREILLTPEGCEAIGRSAGTLPAIWNAPDRSEFLVRQALSAQHLYQRDVQYAIVEQKVVIVDERSGRIMEGRSWSGGLHQAIEAKEGVPLSDPTYSHSQMSFQLFFRQYERLSGMSGTLQNVESELWSIYGLTVIEIPTHAPKRVAMGRELVFQTAEQKWGEAVREISEMVASGRAVLVGTRSIRDSEELHRKVTELGLDAVVLNALRHDLEAEIIAGAGAPGRITIATNMAGRGTDIKVSDGVVSKGGLHVIVTERHESRRVDMQLFGRTSRQGVPGSVRMLTSLEDEIFVRYTGRPLAGCLRDIAICRPGEWIAVQFNRFNQRRAEWLRARQRRQILLQDIRQTKLLSFADN